MNKKKFRKMPKSIDAKQMHNILWYTVRHRNMDKKKAWDLVKRIKIARKRSILDYLKRRRKVK